MAKIRPVPLERKTSKLALSAVQWVALGSSALCGLAIGLGIYPDALASCGAVGFILPLVVAAIVACGLGTGWHFTLGIAAHAEETHKKALAVCLGVGLCAIGCATSAWFLTSKIGGVSAVQAYQLDYVQKLRDALDTTEANAAAEQSLVAAIEMGGNALTGTAKSDDVAGVISGKRGKSIVYRSLSDAAESLATMARKLQTIANDRDEQLAEAKHSLDEATRAIAAHDATQFESAAMKAANGISTADRTRLTATASSLGIGVSADYARTQITAAFAEVGKVARLTSENRRDVSVPIYVPIDAKAAVITNPPVLAWIAALLIEAIPLIGLAILLVLWRDERDDEETASAPVTELRPRPSLVAAE